MKLMLVVAFLLGAVSLAFSGPADGPVIELLPDLKAGVNAETLSNGIPWFSPNADGDILVKGTLLTDSALVRTVAGEWSYTLHRFAYTVTETQKGEFPGKELTFFIEHRFPAPGSMLRVKGLWPFSKDKPLIFRMKKGADRYLITSIEQ